jgi:hypothetical protein
MTLTAHDTNFNTNAPVLYMALELSQCKWLLVFGNGSKIRRVSIEANALLSLNGVVG